MIGLCTRCGAGFDGSEEDVNSPGDDLQGPECPACYRRRKSMGIKEDQRTCHASPLPKGGPNPRDVATPGVSNNEAQS